MNTGTTLALTGDGDLALINGRIPIISGTDKARQDLRVILHSALGSIATDPTFGTDIIALVTSRQNKTLMSGIIRQALEQYRYTTAVGTIIIGEPDNCRKIRITAAVTLTNGDTITTETDL